MEVNPRYQRLGEDVLAQDCTFIDVSINNDILLMGISTNLNDENTPKI